MHNNPFFSIIIAAYNAEPFIARALSSLITQTFDSWEAIIVDDCSSDGTFQAAYPFITTCSKIRFVGLPSNTGPASARNHGVSLALGKWLSILDADDWFCSEKLQIMYDYISTYDNLKLGVIGSDAYVYDHSLSTSRRISYPGSNMILKYNFLHGGRFPPHSSLLLKKSYFKFVGGYNTSLRLSEDWDLIYRLSRISSFKCLKQPLVFYSLHEQNISDSLDNGANILDYRDCSLILNKLSIDVTPVALSEALSAIRTLRSNHPYNTRRVLWRIMLSINSSPFSLSNLKRSCRASILLLLCLAYCQIYNIVLVLYSKRFLTKSISR